MEAYNNFVPYLLIFSITIWGDIREFEPTGTPYNNNILLPVFSWQKDGFTWQEIFKIIMNVYPSQYVCSMQPVAVQHNATFLVNSATLKNPNDIKCDDMSTWIHKGSPTMSIAVARCSNLEIDHIKKLKKSEDISEYKEVFLLKRVYYWNKGSPDVRKIISTVCGKCVCFQL